MPPVKSEVHAQENVKKSLELLQTPEFWHGSDAHGIGVSQTSPVKLVKLQSHVKSAKSIKFVHDPPFSQGESAQGIGVSHKDPVKSIAEQSQLKSSKSIELVQTPEF